ncbi:MAG: monofunctional biosynthetic peptidoglycan transglycosylase [Deltaproteobacteria bacterium]|nr:monofunctional biosynthetic peptidoglycan transglycosylase [Deltaproteobacteria bacterium]
MVRRLIVIALFAVTFLVLVDVCRYFVFPDVAKLRLENPATTAFMEYRRREYREKGKNIRIDRRWVPLSRISPFAGKSVIIAEDDKFWSHGGFDFDAMQKALEKDLRRGTLGAGGSTISQQLAKNLYLSPSRNPIRKVKEAILTWRIERNISKRRIVELYLNVAEWGEGIFGIEAAARTYFDKSARELTARESSRLAAVLPSPRQLNPLGSSRYVAQRAHKIYAVMVRRGIVPAEYDEDVQELISGEDPREALRKSTLLDEDRRRSDGKT